MKSYSSSIVWTCGLDDYFDDSAYKALEESIVVSSFLKLIL